MSDFFVPVPPPPPQRELRKDMPATFTNRATTFLPDVFSLLRNAVGIFKNEARTLMALGALDFLGTIVFAGLISAGIEAAQLSMPALGVFALLGIAVLLVVAIIGSYWFFAWITLSIAYTVKNHREYIGLRTALRKARPHVWAFIWVNIIAILIALGTWILLCLGAMIILSPFYFLFNGILMPLAALAFIFAALVAFVVTATWFGFVTWTFIDENARGLHAIALSKHLSHNHFVSVATRVFLIGLIYLIVIISIQAFFETLFWPFPILLGMAATKLVTNFIGMTVIIPFTYAVFFGLYNDLRTIESIETESTAHGEHRGILITLAAVGLLGMIAFPLTAVAVANEIRTITNQQDDALRHASIDSLQNDLQLYYLAHDNAYPNSIMDLATPGTFTVSGVTSELLTDPATGRPYYYKTTGNDQKYVLCTQLSDNTAYCVSGTGIPTHTTTPAPTTASSTPKSSKK